MTADEIQARTAERKAAGKIPARYTLCPPTPKKAAQAKKLSVRERAALTTACIYRGGETGQLVKCPTCPGGQNQEKVLACAIYPEGCLENKIASGVRCCRLCNERVWPEPPTRATAPVGPRHLLYHIYPVTLNGAWEWNVDQLVRRLALFNGRKVVAIVLDRPGQRPPDPVGPHSPDRARHLAPTATADEVKARFGRHASGIEFIVTDNDPSLREVKTFKPLFSRLKSEPGVTLYAHAKGTTRGNGHPARLWSEILYEVCLDYWPLVEKQLTLHPVTGAFRKMGPGWSRAVSNSDWHYSGSWFWFRNPDLFSQPDWSKIDQFWSGIEPFPSQHWPHAQAGVLFHEGRVPAVNMYSWSYLRQKVLPGLEAWRQRYIQLKTDWGSLAPSYTI